MSIFYSKLKIKGHIKEDAGIGVYSCHYKLARKIDGNGLPYADISAGVIELSLMATEDPDLINFIYSIRKFEGEIVFYGSLNDKPITRIKFKDAILIEYEFYFTYEEVSLIKIVLSARILILGENEFDNKWANT